MALKREYSTADEIPAEHKALYVEKDGKFILDLEAAGDDKLSSTLEKERKRAQAAEKALADLKKALGDVDPAKASEAMKLLAELQENADLNDVPEPIRAKIDAIVRKRTERMAADHQAKLAASEERARGLNSRLETLLIDDGLRTAAAKAGVRPSALDDVVLYGRQTWKLDKDGKPVPMKGEEVQFGKDGKAMTPEEWIAERATDRPHWFEPSTGGGARGSDVKPQGDQLVISGEKAKDFQAYKNAKTQAEKTGKELVISR